MDTIYIRTIIHCFFSTLKKSSFFYSIVATYKRGIVFSVLMTPVIMVVSCGKDWLDVKADRTQAIPSSLVDLQALLDNYTNINRDYVSLGEVASDGHYVNEAAWISATDKAKNAYTWTHDKPYSYSLGMTDWVMTYQKVFQVNVVLDAIKKMESDNNSDIEIIGNIRGQALFHRAYSFYRTAETWAPPYIAERARNDLGIPLRLESDINLPSVRSTVEQAYSQIVNDLKEASKLLPVSPLYKTRPSKTAAFALLARVYLSMRNYSMAGSFADSSIRLNGNLLDYNSLSINATFIGDTRTNPEVIMHLEMSSTGINGFLSTNCLIDSGLLALYSNDDLRRSIFFRINANRTISYKGNYTNSATTPFCGPATDEMYLIRAECYARAGDVQRAMDDLNILLRKRWRKSVPYPLFKAVDAADALNKILVERKKELLLRGLRWSDLRRLNQEDVKEILNRTIGGNTFKLDPNSYRYTFPIPDDIIQVSGIQQNKGW